MKRLVTITAMMLLIATFGFTMAAQDVLYLKNGSVIKGTLLEQTPDKDLKFQTFDGSIYVYPMTDVERITKETAQGSSTILSAATEALTPDLRPTKGVRFGLDVDPFCYGVSKAAEHTWLFMLGLNCGYQFNKYVYVGGGFAPMVSFTSYKGYSSTSFVSPIYGTVRGIYPVGGNIDLGTPFIETRNGIAIYWAGEGAINYYNRESIGVYLGRRTTMALNYTFIHNAGHFLGISFSYGF